MLAFAKEQTKWKGDLYFAVKVVWQKLSKYYAEATLTTCLHLSSENILDPVRKLRSFVQWDNVRDINLTDETSYTTQSQGASLRNVKNQYCAKYRLMSIINPENIPPINIFSSAKISGVR